MSLASNSFAYKKVSESTRKNKTSEATIAKCLEYPLIFRRLVYLYMDKVNLEKVSENPWHKQMKDCNITVDEVKDGVDFVTYSDEIDRCLY